MIQYKDLIMIAWIGGVDNILEAVMLQTNPDSCEMESTRVHLAALPHGEGARTWLLPELYDLLCEGLSCLIPSLKSRNFLLRVAFIDPALTLMQRHHLSSILKLRK